MSSGLVSILQVCLSHCAHHCVNTSTASKPTDAHAACRRNRRKHEAILAREPFLDALLSYGGLDHNRLVHGVSSISCCCCSCCCVHSPQQLLGGREARDFVQGVLDVLPPLRLLEALCSLRRTQHEAGGLRNTWQKLLLKA
jgi:hypothetical protein